MTPLLGSSLSLVGVYVTDLHWNRRVVANHTH